MSKPDSSKEDATPISTTTELSSNQNQNSNELKRPQIPKFNISFSYAAQPDIS